MLSTAAGEVVPLCAPSWVRCLSLESVERRTTPESTTITKTRKGFEVKNQPRNTMLEDVDELMLAKTLV